MFGLALILSIIGLGRGKARLNRGPQINCLRAIDFMIWSRVFTSRPGGEAAADIAQKWIASKAKPPRPWCSERLNFCFLATVPRADFIKGDGWSK